MNFKQCLAALIDFPGKDEREIENLLMEIEDPKMGDFALPCFKFAKELRKSPVVIANEFAKTVKKDEIVEKVEAVNGYLNFFLNREKVGELVLGEIKAANDYGKSDIGSGKTICIDYSSINIAKPFHIGHLGTTAIGNSLKRIYTELGFKVVGINHLGDWGTQFGKLIVAYKLWGNTVDIDGGGLKELQKIYVRFHVEAEKNPALEEEAREWFAKIEQGNREALKLFEYFKKITLDEVKKVYERLDVQFDSWDGESFFNDKMQPLLKELREKKVTEISDGAEIIDLSAYNMPPCLLVKKDGASLYATRDMAAAVYRKKTYDFYKCLYVVALQQNLYFRQLFKALEIAGYEWAKDMVHVAYGMVSLEEGSMSTRKGNTVWLTDVLDKAVEKALNTINEKSPDKENKEQIAEEVGVGAVVFSALCNNRMKDIVFSFDRVLNFDGETSPYIQYTHARCCSVLEKAEETKTVKPDYCVFNNEESVVLLKLLNVFPEKISEAGEKYEPSIIANYLIDVAQAFNKYYFENRILGDDNDKQAARLMLVRSTKDVIAKGLYLLGIKAPQKM